MISEKGEREEGRKKNILEEPLYANYFAGCSLYLSHVSLKVALVNMHKFLNWSIFCPSSSFFLHQFPLFSLHLFPDLWNALARLPFLVGTSQWETVEQDHKVEAERERETKVFLSLDSLHISKLRFCLWLFFIINLLIFDSNYCPHYFDKHRF